MRDLRFIGRLVASGEAHGLGRLRRWKQWIVPRTAHCRGVTRSNHLERCNHRLRWRRGDSQAGHLDTERVDCCTTPGRFRACHVARTSSLRTIRLLRGDHIHPGTYRLRSHGLAVLSDRLSSGDSCPDGLTRATTCQPDRRIPTALPLEALAHAASAGPRSRPNAPTPRGASK